MFTNKKNSKYNKVFRIILTLGLIPTVFQHPMCCAQWRYIECSGQGQGRKAKGVMGLGW